MTEFDKLIREEIFAHTIEIEESSTGKTGVCNSVPWQNMVQVFFGNDDGSDDATISAEEFNQRFRITNVI